MIVEAINEKVGTELTHRQIDSQPLRTIGEHTVAIRLTVDLIPEINVIVHREGETVQQALVEAAELAEAGYDTEAEAEAEIDYDEVEFEAPEAEEETETAVEEADEA
jgi:hypothetical protein